MKRAIAVFLFAFGLSLGVNAAAAQATFPVGQDQSDWDNTSTVAERWLTADTAQKDVISLASWRDLRLTLTLERELALEKAQRGTLPTKLLAAQIAALTPSATRTREEPWLAQRRAQLNAASAAAQAPMVIARDTYARDGVMIAEIDRIVARKARDQLFARRHSILQPAFWIDLSDDLRQVGAPAAAAPADAPPVASLSDQIEIVTALSIAAIAAAVFAHRWIFALAGRGAQTARQNLAFAFLKDAGDIVLPMLVLVSVLMTFSWLRGEGTLLTDLGSEIVFAGAIAIYLHWLGRSVFKPIFAPGRVVTVPDDVAQYAVLLVTGLGILLAAEELVEYADSASATPSTIATLISLVIILGVSTCLWLLARSLRPHHQPEDLSAHPHATRQPGIELLPIVSWLLKIVGLVTPILATAGFLALARSFMNSTVFSLAAACAALFVFRSVRAASVIVFDRLSRRKGSSWQFVPLIFGFAVVIFVIPVVAMIWGVSFDRILDWILALKNGVEIGPVHISFGNVVTFGFVFAIGYFMTRWLQRLVQLVLFPRLHVDIGGKAAILTGVGYVGLTLSAMLAITAAGLDLSSLTFVAGALSVGIGFGLQSVVSNFVSGIILLVERPIREGDWIEVSGVSGHVRRVAFRSTHIETVDRHEIIIPNSALIAGSVTNYNYGGSEGRISLPVSVAYGSNLDAVKSVLLGLAAAHESVLGDPAPTVALEGLGDNAINLKLFCFVDDVNRRIGVRSDLYFEIVAALERAGIEIPYPQRVVRLRNDAAATSDGKPLVS